MIHSTPTDTTDELDELTQSQHVAEIKKKTVSGAASYFIRTLLLQAIGFVTALILSGYLSPEDFGVFGYVTQFIGLLVFFSDIGLAAALVQKKEEPTIREYRTAFTIQLLLSLLIFALVLVLAFSGIIEAKVGMAGVWVLLALGISFPLATVKTVSSIQLERRLDFSTLVIPQIVEQLVFNGVLIVLVLNGSGVIAYAYAVFLRSLIGMVVMWMLQSWPIGIDWDRAPARHLLGFGSKFQLNDFLARVKDQLFFVVLAWFLPLKEFGYIQWAKNWSMYPYNLTVQNVMSITFPTFSRLQHHPALLKKAIEKSLFFITLAIFPLIVGMSVFVLPLVSVISKYQKWEPAVISFVFFTVSIAWSAISSPLTNTLNAIGHVDETLKLMVMWTVLTWVLTPLCIVLFGYHGVAIAAFLIACTSIVPLMIVKRIIAIDVWSQVWRQLIAALVMGGFGILFLSVWQLSVAWMLVGMAASSGVYLAVLWGIGRQTILSEVKSLRSKAAPL